MEKRKGFFCLYCFFCIIENSICFSLYFFDEEFYTDVKTLNEQENGGVGVVRGRKVGGLDFVKLYYLNQKIIGCWT
jgi:hypothetical protein